MAEIIQRDGTWAFDGTTVRITPGLHRSVPLFRQTYGEVAVPLEAVAGVVFELLEEHAVSLGPEAIADELKQAWKIWNAHRAPLR